MDKQALGKHFDNLFFLHLKAQYMMTARQKKGSDRRSRSYQKQWEAYRVDQRNKYGIDGGPSPCIVMKDPFTPHA